MIIVELTRKITNYNNKVNSYEQCVLCSECVMKLYQTQGKVQKEEPHVCGNKPGALWPRVI